MGSYLFALVDAGGTVPPETGVARRLVQRGHRVEVLAEDSMIEDVRATGAAFRPWRRAVNRPDHRPEHDPLRDWEIRNPVELFRRMVDGVLVGPAPDYAADLTATIGDFRPDLVVSSFFAIGAMVGAEAAGLPYVALIPNIYPLPVAEMPPFGLAGLNELRESYGLKPIGDLWDQVRQAHKVLVLTSSSFDFPARLPASVRYVGPILDDPAWAAEQRWAPPAGDEALVLLAMSSTFQDQVGVLQRCVDALGALPVRGVATTGLVVAPAEIRSVPNVAVFASAPHSEVLEHASVVVTHGGHGTVMRTLAAGVPMVILPQGRDQADNAVRVASRGAGLTLKSTAAAGEIADAVQAVLADPRYRQAAERLGACIRTDAASGALVAELEDLPS